MFAVFCDDAEGAELSARAADLLAVQHQERVDALSKL
jgi:hypothetical protein